MAEGGRQPGSSKYDFVKVRVRLSDRHYYVLSRFLVSRVLTATKVHYTDAIRIALELKKALVDTESLDTTQAAMEDVLFTIVKNHGYGEETLHLYRMVSSFHHHRIPLIILIGGSAAVGKSTLATQLAERLNLSSVLQTDVVYSLMASIVHGEGALPPYPPSLRTTPAPATADATELHARYQRECDLVAHGLSAEFAKCLKEGKSMIVEGFHAHASLMASPVDALAVAHAVIVPFVVVVRDRNDHHQLYREWRQHQHGAHAPTTVAPDAAMDDPLAELHFQQLRVVQDPLVDAAAAKPRTAAPESALTTVTVDVDSLDFDGTLDQMHSVVLARMQQLLLLRPITDRGFPLPGATSTLSSLVGS